MDMEALACYLRIVSETAVGETGTKCLLSLEYTLLNTFRIAVEPLPDSWLKIPILGLLTTSTFHAQHHQDIDHNFGFYTLIWDRLFGTISPEYYSHFGRVSTIKKLTL